MTEINALGEFPTSTAGRSVTQSNLSAVPPTEVLLLEQLAKSIAPSTATEANPHAAGATPSATTFKLFATTVTGIRMKR
jgi:hypothetical protein